MLDLQSGIVVLPTRLCSDRDGHLLRCRFSDDAFSGGLSPCMSSDSEGEGDFLPCRPFDEDYSGLHITDDKDVQGNESVEADLWSHLPEDLLHLILAWLPSRSILRFRYVCKQWKCLFASPRFRHFASHRTLVAPWIFLYGRSNSSRAKLEVCLSRGYERRDEDNAKRFVKGADACSGRPINRDGDRFEKRPVKRDYNFEDRHVNRDDNHEDRHASGSDDYVVGYGGIYSSRDNDECYTYARDARKANGDWDDKVESSPLQLSYDDASQVVSKVIVGDRPGYTHCLGYDHIDDIADVEHNSQADGYFSGGQGGAWSFQLSSRSRSKTVKGLVGRHGNGCINYQYSICNGIGNDDLANSHFSGENRDCCVSGDDEHGIRHANGYAGDKQEAGSCKNYSLLIFDCESGTWLPPLAIPAGLKGALLNDSFTRSIICSSKDRVLIPAGVPCRIYVENPAALSRQELPSFISIQGTPHALGFAEEKATPYTMCNLQTSMRFSGLKDYSLMPLQSLHLKPLTQNNFVQDNTSKNFQVIAVGETSNGTLVLEIYSSSRDSWHVGAIFPSNFIFYKTRLLECDSKEIYQTQIVECNGSFFALLGRPDALVLMRSIRTGQEIEWSLRDLPWPPTPDGVFRVLLWESSLVACRDSVFLIGATKTYLENQYYRHDEYSWGILIWRFHPQFLDDSCWQLLVTMPHRIFKEFYGEISYLTPECCSHGDVIFFQDPNSRRILMYDVSQDFWTFSQECEYDIQSMVCVWEPLVMN